jgi:hypothetical protein
VLKQFLGSMGVWQMGCVWIGQYEKEMPMPILKLSMLL